MEASETTPNLTYQDRYYKAMLEDRDEFKKMQAEMNAKQPTPYSRKKSSNRALAEFLFWLCMIWGLAYLAIQLWAMLSKPTEEGDTVDGGATG